MKSSRLTYTKNILIPALLFSSIAGILTGLAVFVFRMVASLVISLSEEIYATVRMRPHLLPLLLAGAAVLGLFAALILRHAKSCRGGGIPTSVALLRGLIHFKWISSIFVLFTTAMLSFLGGLPLGSEGPCVQMGTAVGSGTVRIFGKKNRAWERYIMTGGACAGFACATGAPITGIFFAFEEAHRRFSPMLFMTASVAVLTGSYTTQILCDLSGTDFFMFTSLSNVVLPLRYLWTALIVGIICGFCAVLFTKLYRLLGHLINERAARLPFIPKLMLAFVAVALTGFASAELIGSGHHLIDELLNGHMLPYLLLLYLCVRALMLLISHHAGATGGLFVPSLAFGAMIGALCADGLIALHLLPEQYYAFLVVIGMASFLSASARTPTTAVIFAAETLCGFEGILPVAAGVTLAYLVIEVMGVTAFNDTVIETKVAEETRGKTAQIVDTHMTVKPGSFAIGKEIRDILWPPSCVILSVCKAPQSSHAHTIGEGDVLHIHYQTFDPAETSAMLAALLGEQEHDPVMDMYPEDDHHNLPDQ